MSEPAKRAVAWALMRSGTLAVHRRLLERSRAAVLMYHRVNDDDDPFFPALPSRAFRRQVEYLACRYRLVTLDEIVEWLDAGAPGPARIALTIDDGYADTHDVVLPELQRLGVPATLFLATAPPEDGVPLWLDRTRHLIKHGRGPSLTVPELDLRGVPLDAREGRLAALRTLARRMKHLKPETLEAVIRRLEAGLEVEAPPPRCLSWDQVRALAKGPVSIGAHTHTHYLLSTMDQPQIGREIARSVELIAQRVGARPTTFAYPNGEAADYDERAKRELRLLGLKCAMTTHNGFARPGHDLLALPRVYTSESHLPLFAARLAGLGTEVA